LKNLFFILFFLLNCPSFFADNGRVVHIAWTQNKDGSIQNASLPNHGLQVFEQRNQFLNYKDPNNPLFKIRYSWLGIDWTIVHLLALLFTITLQILTFKRINRRMTQSRFFKRWSFRLLKLFLWFAVFAGNAGAIWAIDFYNTQIHFRYHQLSDFQHASMATLEKQRHNRTYFISKETNRISHQLYIKSKHKWHTQRALPVLHFQLKKNGKLYFKYDKRYFKPHPDSSRVLASSQLFVFHRQQANGKDSALIYQLENKQLVAFEFKKDRPKRLLLMVNGYRPISTSQDPEKALQAINDKGLERPRSKNLIFGTDLFHYWPQQNFIAVLENRLATERTFFADGHHSVRTSNHRSLLQFISGASLYPNPCRATHTCSTTKIANQQEVRTYQLLATKSNKEGFTQRYRAGKQAGRNLLQELKKNGNDTQNDTLYVVSHSMGHAYFLGIASVLKGKIQLGAYFAFAPENPKGKTLPAHLKPLVKQYGTKLYGPQRHAPCQQDGVAPQWRISGLPPEQQFSFPKALRARLGYFSSHYIGYYTWVFEIPRGKPGYIGLL